MIKQLALKVRIKKFCGGWEKNYAAASFCRKKSSAITKRQVAKKTCLFY
jgi:hypothetical protein